MKDLLTKTFGDIGFSDIDRLIEAGEEESLVLEIKGPLPVPKGQDDPWAGGKRKILDYTRDEVLAEIVGMLNAAGGLVILGVAETNDHPKRADKPHPLPECVQLAARLADKAWSCIDPRLPNLEVKGIPIPGEDDAGFVIFRVPTASPRAPFGLSTKHRAYVRRGSNTEPMLVSEIRDRTLQNVRQIDLIEHQFAERRQAFNQWRHQDDTPCSTIRATVIPTATVVSADAPYAHSVLWPQDIGQVREIMIGDTRTTLLVPHLWTSTSPPRPILRGGVRIFYEHERVECLRQFVLCDGRVDFWFRQREVRPRPHTSSHFHVAHVLGAAFEALRIARKVAQHGGAPGVELELELELADYPNDKAHVTFWHDQILQDPLPLPAVLPRQGVPSDDLSIPLTSLLDDLLNAAGATSAGEVRLES